MAVIHVFGRIHDGGVSEKGETSLVIDENFKSFDRKSGSLIRIKFPGLLSGLEKGDLVRVEATVKGSLMNSALYLAALPGQYSIEREPLAKSGKQ